LKYGPRSKLRRACSRFLRFSYLLDFLALDALSSIYIESVKDTILKLKRLANLKVDCELRSGAA
jgi:dynein heavy chain